jgi:YD repeat-containing protein
LSRDGARDALKAQASQVGATVSNETYSYDTLNRLTDVARTEDGKSASFDYDVISQMTNAEYGLVNNINPTRNVAYTWDKSGNRTLVNDTGVNTSYTVNQTNTNKALNQYAKVGASPVTNGNEHEIASY